MKSRFGLDRKTVFVYKAADPEYRLGKALPARSAPRDRRAADNLEFTHGSAKA